MTTFRYTAVDGRGQPVSGELAAPGADEALRQLKNYGLFHSVIGASEPPPAPASLSAAQAAELAGHVASLSKAGLPLPAGLRALADELPRGPVAQAMRAIAGQMEAGRSLEEAVQTYAERLPGPMRAVVAAGHRAGRLAVVLEQFVELEQARADLRRRLASVLAYPTVLLLMLLGLELFLNIFVVPQFRQIFGDFGARLPNLTEFTLSFFSPAMNGQVLTAGLLVVLLFFLFSTGRPAWAQSVLYWVPVVGSVWRWNALAEFARWMAILFDGQFSLPEALRLTAAGLSDSDLGRACREAAERAEAGCGFAESLAGLRQFPPMLMPLVAWGQYAPRPAEAMRTAAEMFDDRARTRADLLESVLSPILFLFIVGMVGMATFGLLLPFISMISYLH